jgi:hypothetical protein
MDQGPLSLAPHFFAPPSFGLVVSHKLTTVTRSYEARARKTMPNCLEPIANIVGLSARIGAKGTEQIDFSVPVVLLDMKDYP